MPKLTVHFWDGTTKPAAIREEAVQILKTGLEAWMQKGDYIAWARRPIALKRDINFLPSFAMVVNERGEITDAWASISGEGQLKQQPTLAQENNEIAAVFERIKTIATVYLTQQYPEAPDPDQYIGQIEEQINKYNQLTGNTLSIGTLVEMRKNRKEAGQ